MTGDPQVQSSTSCNSETSFSLEKLLGLDRSRFSRGVLLIAEPLCAFKLSETPAPAAPHTPVSPITPEASALRLKQLPLQPEPLQRELRHLHWRPSDCVSTGDPQIPGVKLQNPELFCPGDATGLPSSGFREQAQLGTSFSSFCLFLSTRKGCPAYRYRACPSSSPPG